jgi:regulator of RNase E activity RraA
MMKNQPVTQENITEVSSRFLQLYTGAIADMLDKNGYRNQVLPYYVTPFTNVSRVAGLAFTIQGYPSADAAGDDTKGRPGVLESIMSILDCVTPGTVAMLAVGGSTDCAHWGEIMSTAVKQRGCTGTVTDGGVRDVDFVNAMKFPVFAKFKCAASVVSRFGITDSQVSIKIGNTVVRPGDFVFGDTDGVVVIPQALTLDVLAAAEEVFQREGGMREELRRGLSVKEAYAKFGAF